jgi:hypothetical protein
MVQYDIYNVDTWKIIETLDSAQVEAKYKIAADEVDWAIEEYGACEIETGDDELKIAIVHQGDELPDDMGWR